MYKLAVIIYKKKMILLYFISLFSFSTKNLGITPMKQCASDIDHLRGVVVLWAS